MSPRLKHAITAVCLIVAGILVWAFWGDQIADFFRGETETAVLPTTPSTTTTETPKPAVVSVAEIEKQTFDLINEQRENNGAPATVWDDELYTLSKAHTEEMAERGELFHTPQYASYGENCWGGYGYYRYSADKLAQAIVESWMSSPLHRAWLLHAPIRHSVVSVVVSEEGQYASWTFWTDEIGLGPELVRQISDEWRRETGESIPWIDWLYMKGYLK
jgi:uncharacterized protein YkwD